MQNYNYPEWRIKRVTYGGTYIRDIEATNTTKTQAFNGSTITAIAQASNLSHARYNENITSPELTIDPVRLPPDGKVPIYRAGDIVVISHTATTDAETPTAGQAINLARDH